MTFSLSHTHIHLGYRCVTKYSEENVKNQHLSFLVSKVANFHQESFFLRYKLFSEKHFYHFECSLERILTDLTVKGLQIPHTNFKWHVSTKLCLGIREQAFLLLMHPFLCIAAAWSHCASVQD